MTRLDAQGRPECRCGGSAYRPDTVTGRRQALRCSSCHRLVGRCNCQIGRDIVVSIDPPLCSTSRDSEVREAAKAVDAAWEEPDDPDDIAEDRISMPGDEGDVEPFTPDTNEMVAALRGLRVALGGRDSEDYPAAHASLTGLFDAALAATPVEEHSAAWASDAREVLLAYGNGWHGANCRGNFFIDGPCDCGLEEWLDRYAAEIRAIEDQQEEGATP